MAINNFSETKVKKSNDSSIYNFPVFLLQVFGGVDLLRGFLHTYEISWAANTFAKLDLSTARADQLTLLGAFGISNFLTGFIYLLISRKAPTLSPYVLGIIPLAYLLGFIGLKVSRISSTSAFYGKYFMLAYLLIAAITFGIFMYKKNVQSKQ